MGMDLTLGVRRLDLGVKLGLQGVGNRRRVGLRRLVLGVGSRVHHLVLGREVYLHGLGHCPMPCYRIGQFRGQAAFKTALEAEDPSRLRVDA